MKNSEQISGGEGPVFRIETLKAPKGGEVSFSPDRGGIITSLKLNGREILYLDEATFKDPSKNVKGGIPIMFPNAGPIESPHYPGLKQHGFARTSSEWRSAIDSAQAKFSEVFRASDKTRAIYPHNFELRVGGVFNKDGSFTLTQEVSNPDSSQKIPVSMGLHPYFRVPHAEKPNIKFDFPGGEEAEKRVEVWANDGTISLENPNAPLRITIPGLGTLVLEVSPEYKRIWIWSLPGKDFICIEPVMRDEGGLIDDPEMVAKENPLVGKVRVSLES